MVQRTSAETDPWTQVALTDSTCVSWQPPVVTNDPLKQSFQDDVSALRCHQDEFCNQVRWLESLYHANDRALVGFDGKSDESLIECMMRFLRFAERMHDNFAGIEQCIERLESIRSIGLLWNDDAEALLMDLRAILPVVQWAETAAREWSRQTCDEYERRHPELPPLPFEPLDLGPTNAARMPDVI